MAKNILAEFGNLLVQAELARKQRAAAALTVSEAESATTAGTTQTEAAQPVNHTISRDRKQNGGDV